MTVAYFEDQRLLGRHVVEEELQRCRYSIDELTGDFESFIGEGQRAHVKLDQCFEQMDCFEHHEGVKG